MERSSKTCGKQGQRSARTLRLKRTFESRDPSLWKDLYAALIRPHLEYAVQTWNPHLIGDIEKHELVQRRTLKIPEGFENLSYNERLGRLNLT